MNEGTSAAIVEGIHIRPADRSLPSLPKQAIQSVTVRTEGLVGDFNHYRHRKHEDSPHMAVMVLHAEALTALNAEGWPVKPGDIGENFLVSGLPTDIWHDGTRLRVGKDVELELSERCEPCSNLHGLPYVGKEQGKSFVQTLIGRRGYYARVLVPGDVHVGDAVVVVSKGASG